MIQRLRKEALLDRDYFWLSDEQFAKLQPHLPTDTRGKPRVDDRQVISGIVHVIKSGGRRAVVDAPAVYGSRKTLYNHFQRWPARGVWSDIFNTRWIMLAPDMQGQGYGRQMMNKGRASWQPRDRDRHRGQPSVGPLLRTLQSTSAAATG